MRYKGSVKKDDPTVEANTPTPFWTPCPMRSPSRVSTGVCRRYSPRMKAMSSGYIIAITWPCTLPADTRRALMGEVQVGLDQSDSIGPWASNRSIPLLLLIGKWRGRSAAAVSIQVEHAGRFFVCILDPAA